MLGDGLLANGTLKVSKRSVLVFLRLCVFFAPHPHGGVWWFVQVLSLSGNRLTDRGVLAYVAPVLQIAPASVALEQLVLRDNLITALGQKALEAGTVAFNSNRTVQLRIFTSSI